MLNETAAWPYIETFILLLSCCSLALYGVVVVWRLVRVDERKSVPSTEVRTMAHEVWIWCRAKCTARCQNEDNAVSAAAYKLFQERHRAMCRSAAFVVSPVFAMGVLWTICQGTGLIRLDDGLRLQEKPHAVICAIVLAFVALCLWCPEQPTKRVILALQLVGFMSLMWTLCSYTTGLGMLFDRSTSFAFRVAFALMLCDLRLTLALNSMYSALAMYRFGNFASTDEGIAQLGLRCFMYQELGAIVILSGVHLVMSWRMEAQALSTIEAKASMNVAAGFSKLLKKSYHVVVELSEDLRLTGETQDLAGLLLHGPHRSLQGTRFVDLMAFDVDMQAFISHATQPALASQSTCCAIPHTFRMRDSDSNLLRLEVFHTRLEDLDTGTRHLIGIKERGVDEESSCPRQRPSTAASLARTPSTASTVLHPEANLRLSREERNSEAATDEVFGSSSSEVSRRRNRSRPPCRDAVQPRQGHIDRHCDQGNTPHNGGLTDPPLVGPQPQVVGASSADGESDGEDSDRTPPVLSTPVLEKSNRVSIEGFKPTTPYAQRASMLMQLSRWNVSLPAARCCTYHAVIGEAKHVVKALGVSECNDFNLLQNLCQCPCCGIMAISAVDEGYGPDMRGCSLCQPISSSSTSIAL